MRGIKEFLQKNWLQEVDFSTFGKKPGKVDMLRLDLIHPALSGNKWLKLNDWLEKFATGGYKGILTKGGPWSNHLHACGFACKENKTPMLAIIKGHENLQNPLLQDLADWGITIQFCNRELYYNETHWQDLATQMGYVYIPMGGDGPEGMNGVTAFFNLLPLEEYNALVCSVGTGTTLSGIMGSRHFFKKVVGLDPGTGDRSLKEKISRHLKESQQLEFYALEKKFGRPTEALITFMKQWESETGIPLDHVYTGPMCQQFVELYSAGTFGDMDKVLLVHTGGLQGNRKG